MTCCDERRINFTVTGGLTISDFINWPFNCHPVKTKPHDDQKSIELDFWTWVELLFLVMFLSIYVTDIIRKLIAKLKGAGNLPRQGVDVTSAEPEAGIMFSDTTLNPVKDDLEALIPAKSVFADTPTQNLLIEDSEKSEKLSAEDEKPFETDFGFERSHFGLENSNFETFTYGNPLTSDTAFAIFDRQFPDITPFGQKRDVFDPSF